VQHHVAGQRGLQHRVHEGMTECPPGRAKDREKGIIMLALKLNTDAPFMETHSENFKRVLDFAYDAIGCDCIEAVHPVHLPKPYVMIVDESGMLNRRPVNPIGSALYGTNIHGWPIVGPALIMKEAMTIDGPDIVTLKEQDIATLQNIINNTIDTVKED